MKRVLYFTRDFSAENIALAKEHNLMMRDLRVYGNDDFLETCDAVTGDVPKEYEEKYETVSLDEVYKVLAEPEDKTFASTKEPESKEPESKEPTPDQMREKLTEAGVDFHPLLGDKNVTKLYEKTFKEG